MEQRLIFYASTCLIEPGGIPRMAWSDRSAQAASNNRVLGAMWITMSNPAALPSSAIALPPDGGRVYEMKTLRAVFKADGEETGGRYSISEWWLDPHKPGPGAHKHDEGDDIFYVLEGNPSILLGERWFDAPKGSFVRAPAGVMHDFENRTDARIGLLNFSIPGGFEPMMPTIVKWFNENR